tara:strand:- start:2940 stop:3638 length:699 start_codon:yes stop_codon:yes gene_type:complete
MNKKPVIAITGTRTGIGRHLAAFYLSKGFHVMGCSRNETDFRYDNYHHFKIDISDETSVQNMFKTIRKEFGYLDVLINNAGTTSMNYAVLTPLKEVKKVFDTNFFGTFLCCREAVKIMQRKKFGRIINFSSIHTQLGIHGTSIYGASKSAIEQFSLILAKEVLQFGISVNIISLSVVEDSGMAENLSDEIKKEILKGSVSKTPLKIKDILDVINSLIDDRSKMATGQNISLG